MMENEDDLTEDGGPTAFRPSSFGVLPAGRVEHDVAIVS
jgi:hypothetical protein